MTDHDRYFVDDRHALYVGWVVGLAKLNGIDARPVTDHSGRFYTDRIDVEWGRRHRITVIVPPPPDDWTFPDDLDDE